MVLRNQPKCCLSQCQRTWGIMDGHLNAMSCAQYTRHFIWCQRVDYCALKSVCLKAFGLGRLFSVFRQLLYSTFERVEEFKYLGTTLTNQNSIAEEIKSRLRSGNACYHSVQNLLSSRLPSKNLKIKIYRTIILPVVLY